MPYLIQSIDTIARQKSRDVLYVSFPECDPYKEKIVYPDECKVRQEVIAWLDQAGFSWQPCVRVAKDGLTPVGSMGDIYIDLPFDTTNADYRKLAEFLETPDGKMKIEGVEFRYLPLEKAMQYKHHDEPGHREEQAEEW
jgi:hypothetical protein